MRHEAERLHSIDAGVLGAFEAVGNVRRTTRDGLVFDTNSRIFSLGFQPEYDRVKSQPLGGKAVETSCADGKARWWWSCFSGFTTWAADSALLAKPYF